MKGLKRFAALLIAVMMVMSTISTAFATDLAEGTNGDAEPTGVIYEESKTVDIKINTHDHKDFYAIQIFKGTQTIGTNQTAFYPEVATADGDNNNLGDIEWGTGAAGKQKEIIEAVNVALGYATYTNENTATGYALKADLPADAKPLATVDNGSIKQATALEVANAIATSVNGEATNMAAFDDARAKDLARYLGVILYNQPSTKLTQDGKNEVPIGYYLIVDKKDPLYVSTSADDPKKGDAYNAALLQMTKDITINVKSDAPNVEKKIITSASSKTDVTLADSNSANIGDIITYEIDGKIPDVSSYDYYYYVLNDTFGTGLEFQNNIVVYKKVGNDLVALTKDKDYYVYTGENADGKTFQVAFADVKAAQTASISGYADDKRFSDDVKTRANAFKNNDANGHTLPAGTEIVVRYTARLTEDAVIGNSGNPNKLTLTYSHNPNKSEEHDQTGKPGIPDTDKDVAVGETPEDVVITYTSSLHIKKWGEVVSGEVLSGAEFTLTGKSKVPIVQEIENYVKSDSGTWYRLQDGTYTETAPTGDRMTESGKGNEVNKGYVVDSTYTEMDKVVIDGTTYRPYVADTDNKAEVQVYKLTGGNADLYSDTKQKYEKKVSTETGWKEVDIQWVGVTDENGEITFKGIGAGVFTLEETLVPNGYNKAAIVQIDIDVDLPQVNKDGDDKVYTDKDQAEWKLGAQTSKDSDNKEMFGVSDDQSIAVFLTDIVDAKGATLPETGGIGTTLFYAGGAILVLLAGILLVSKRRIA